MDNQQRTSALQQRLQARREMFMKENSLGGAAPNGTPAQPAAGAAYTPGKLSVGSAPAGAPPQPPATAPRAVQGALASLRKADTFTLYENKETFVSFTDMFI
jgi:hypothetical protein